MKVAAFPADDGFGSVKRLRRAAMDAAARMSKDPALGMGSGRVRVRGSGKGSGRGSGSGSGREGTSGRGRKAGNTGTGSLTDARSANRELVAAFGRLLRDTPMGVPSRTRRSTPSTADGMHRLLDWVKRAAVEGSGSCGVQGGKVPATAASAAPSAAVCCVCRLSLASMCECTAESMAFER